MSQLPGFAPTDIRDATISDDGVYRYDLTRRWATGPTALWIMLNPSTADAQDDDQTIRTIRGISTHNGCGALAVVNLYALRSRDPDALLRHPDPTGPRNAETIKRWLADRQVAFVVAGWGQWRTKHRNNPELPFRLNVEQFAKDELRTLLCIQRLKDGEPRHPLYAKHDSTLIPWRSS